MPERLLEHERDSGWSTHSATDAASGKIAVERANHKG